MNFNTSTRHSVLQHFKYAMAFMLVFTVCKSFSQDTTRLSLLFLGDIMQHDSQISAAYDPDTKKYDYTSCFQFIKPYIASVDLAIGNLEVTLAGPPYQGYPTFSAPDELLLTLKDVGMDVLVTANNHCVDKGKKGLERTIEMLDSVEIPHTGTFVDEASRLNDYPLIIQKNGFKLAILNYTFSTNGLPVTSPNIVNRIDTTQIRHDLDKARKMFPDKIIVFTHWGVEYQSFPAQSQKDVTEFCFRHGADLVIGAHPHVIQPMEWRKKNDQVIAYSLGNFVSGQRKRYTDGGAMLRVELEKVAFKPDSATTRIDSVSYMLEWVYKNPEGRKKYYILPVPGFENDRANFVKDAPSRTAMKTFIDDSRELYRKNNLDVVERMNIPPDTIFTYRVLFLTTTAYDPNEKYAEALYPIGIETAGTAEGQPMNVDIFSGEFVNLPEAEKHCRKLIHTGYQHARVVKYANGVRVN